MTVPLRMTFASNPAIEAGDMITLSTDGRPKRVQVGGDGALYAYPDWPGRNRHERRAAQSRARHIRSNQ